MSFRLTASRTSKSLPCLKGGGPPYGGGGIPLWNVRCKKVTYRTKSLSHDYVVPAPFRQGSLLLKKQRTSLWCHLDCSEAERRDLSTSVEMTRNGCCTFDGTPCIPRCCGQSRALPLRQELTFCFYGTFCIPQCDGTTRRSFPTRGATFYP